jgi:preprotein translocase subunit YajC
VAVVILIWLFVFRKNSKEDEQQQQQVPSIDQYYATGGTHGTTAKTSATNTNSDGKTTASKTQAKTDEMTTTNAGNSTVVSTQMKNSSTIDVGDTSKMKSRGSEENIY